MSQTLKPLDIATARDMVADGATLVDIREDNERAVERIPGAQHVALSAIGADTRIDAEPGKPVIFHCASGMRTKKNESALAALTDREAYVMEGGLNAWRDAGLPTEK